MLTDLAVTPISETIRQLSARRRSGDLQVRSGKLAKMAFFDHGRLVFAASNLKRDRLGESLITLGRITDRQFGQASDLMKGAARLRFGDALVEAGVMDKREVGHMVARWVAKILISLFDLQAGAAFFEERRCPIPLEYMVSLSVHRILYLGIRSMTNPDLVLAGVGDLDRSMTLASVPPFNFALKKCAPDDVAVLERAKTRVTMRRLASTPKGLSFTRLRAAYAFFASGLLEDCDDARAAEQPVVQMETGTFLLSPAQRRHPTAEPDALPQEVIETIAAPPGESVAPAAAEPEPAPAPPAPVAVPSTSSGGTMEIEHLLMEASVHLAVSDFGGAVQTYNKLVELMPDVAAYRARLASTMARWPATARQAERQFLEALRLAPDDSELHYQFGLYYKAMKVRSRSVAEFRTVVRLDPRHKLARAELESLSPRDSALTSLKKLLG